MGPEHGAMQLRHGRTGDFYGCVRYADADCRNTAPVGIGIACPRCHAPVVERVARKSRKPFWPCSRRECAFVPWERPHTCSACGAGCFGAERPHREAAAGPDPAIPDRDVDGDIVPF
jgi:ssDNA-binding Zn-finger/Zn-ribbon topoisomerase 1